MAAAYPGFRSRPLRHRDGRRLDHAGTAEQGLILDADHAGRQDADRALRDRSKFETLADIDRPGTRVIVNPGGTNERFTRANIKSAEIRLYADNVTIFDEIAKGHADLMITDASETRYQQKLHPGVLCAVHPDQPFDHAQKAYWLQRDSELKSFVDGWLKSAVDDGRFAKIYRSWFE